MTARYLNDEELVDEVETRTSRRLEAHIEDIQDRASHRLRTLAMSGAVIAAVALLSVLVSAYFTGMSRENATVASHEARVGAANATTAATEATAASNKAASAATNASIAASEANAAAQRATAATNRAATATGKMTVTLRDASAAIAHTNAAAEKALTAASQAATAAQQNNDTTQSLRRTASELSLTVEKKLSELRDLETHLIEELDRVRSAAVRLEQGISRFEKVRARLSEEYRRLISTSPSGVDDQEVPPSSAPDSDK